MEIRRRVVTLSSSYSSTLCEFEADRQHIRSPKEGQG